ncbi:MAG: MFS transporter [Candidatus Sumerlaeaceae bacterium]|nr:MFS transporter [Candidatus Sumerlaeaceae bacterium]
MDIPQPDAESEPEPVAPKPRRSPSAFRALSHRNYSLFISGQIFSLVGTWMQSTALSWLVYKMTSDPFKLGLVSFASQIPVLLLGVYAGLFADRYNRHKIIITTQVFLMLQSMALSILTLSHGPNGEALITYWTIVGLGAFSGVLQAFDLPARQAFLVQMVPKDDLGNAIALNSLTFNAARIAGPALAGELVAIIQQRYPAGTNLGEGICFVINTLSFLFVIVQLVRMKLPPHESHVSEKRSFQQMQDGFRYVGRSPHILALLLFVGAVAVVGLPYLTMITVFAKDIVHGDARTLGRMTMSVGVGAIIGGTIMARRKRVAGTGNLIVFATIGFSVSITLFSWMRDVITSCFFLGCSGLCMVCAMIGAQTLTQMLVKESYRARVMSLYAMMNMGLMPFGNLFTGAVAKAWDPRWAMTINAALCVVTALILGKCLPMLRDSARRTPEYEHMTAEQ